MSIGPIGPGGPGQWDDLFARFFGAAEPRRAQRIDITKYMSGDAREVLSVAARRASSEVTSNTTKYAPALEGLRILVLEDDQDASGMIQTMLEDCHATVSVAASASEGLDLIDPFRPDVIVSDIGLPEQDGYWFIAQLRSRPSDRGGRTPAVALTAHARVEDRARALYAGFNNHVPKPIDPIELFAVIAALRPRV